MVTGLTNIPKKGPRFDYYLRFTVTSTFFGGDDGYDTTDGYQPNVIIPFSTQGIIIMNEDTSSVVEFSTDGTNVAGRINPTITHGFIFDDRVMSLIWFRLASGASAVVNVQAWGIR